MADSVGDTIIFLGRSYFYVYDANNIFKLDVPASMVHDLDIIDKAGFDSLIDTFIKSKELGSGRLWIILSDEVCFSKDFVEPDAAKFENEVKDFLEAVPFDQVISKRFKSQSGIRVIATNMELIETVIEIFDKNGFVTEAVTPGAIFPGYNTKKVLDTDFARFILDNKVLTKHGNMLAKVDPVAPAAEVTESKKENKFLPYLAIGFVVLLIILVGVILTRK